MTRRCEVMRRPAPCSRPMTESTSWPERTALPWRWLAALVVILTRFVLCNARDGRCVLPQLLPHRARPDVAAGAAGAAVPRDMARHGGTWSGAFATEARGPKASTSWVDSHLGRVLDWSLTGGRTTDGRVRCRSSHEDTRN